MLQVLKTIKLVASKKSPSGKIRPKSLSFYFKVTSEAQQSIFVKYSCNAFHIILEVFFCINLNGCYKKEKHATATSTQTKIRFTYQRFGTYLSEK